MSAKKLDTKGMNAGGRVRRRSMGGTLVLLVALVLCSWPAQAAAATGDYRCVDPSKVYLGNRQLLRSPCTIRADEVYARIAEYRQIVDEGLTDKDVRYHLLMKKVSKRFADAVKSMARTHRHRLVAQSGAVVKAREEAPDVPDRTAETIAALS